MSLIGLGRKSVRPLEPIHDRSRGGERGRNAPLGTTHRNGRKDMRRFIIAGASVALVLGMFAGTASAAHRSPNRLRLETCTGGDSNAWARGTDSPNDGNQWALVTTVASGGCADAYSTHTG